MFAAISRTGFRIEKAKTIDIKVSNIFFFGGGGQEGVMKYCALSDCLQCFFTITAEILACSLAIFIVNKRTDT